MNGVTLSNLEEALNLLRQAEEQGEEDAEPA